MNQAIELLLSCTRKMFGFKKIPGCAILFNQLLCWAMQARKLVKHESQAFD